VILLQSDSFSNSLSKILIYIAKDSKDRARQFNKALQNSLKALPEMPYKFRKSIYFENENIRDYVFMGYCIPYFIQKEQGRIVLLDIIKWRQNELT
jgi:plasmid stabilization system protein ParE